MYYYGNECSLILTKFDTHKLIWILRQLMSSPPEEQCIGYSHRRRSHRAFFFWQFSNALASILFLKWASSCLCKNCGKHASWQSTIVMFASSASPSSTGIAPQGNTCALCRVAHGKLCSFTYMFGKARLQKILISQGWIMYAVVTYRNPVSQTSSAPEKVLSITSWHEVVLPSRSFWHFW